MLAEAPYSITALPVSLVGLTQLEDVRVALERSVDGKTEGVSSLDPHTQAWLADQLKLVRPEQLIQALEQLAADAPVIDIEIAAVPSDEWRERLVAWFRNQVSPIVLIRIHTRRTLLAGMRVRTGKHEYDMSLATRLHSATGKMQEILHAN